MRENNELSFLIVLFNFVIVVFLAISFFSYPCDSDIYFLLARVLFSCIFLVGSDSCSSYFTITYESAIIFYWWIGDWKTIIKILQKALGISKQILRIPRKKARQKM